MKYEYDTEYEYAGFEAFSSIQSDEMAPPPGVENGFNLTVTVDNAHLVAQALIRQRPSIANALHDELSWQLSQANKYEKGHAA